MYAIRSYYAVAEVIRIQEEGRKARANAEIEIKAMEVQLKDNLINMKKKYEVETKDVN